MKTIIGNTKLEFINAKELKQISTDNKKAATEKHYNELKQALIPVLEDHAKNGFEKIRGVYVGMFQKDAINKVRKELKNLGYKSTLTSHDILIVKWSYSIW